MSIDVSVIIPVYNRAATVMDAVQSVLAQTYPTFELLIVDDGSIDNSLELISSLDDPRIRIIRHANNKGAAAARNTGIREARNQVVAFLDSDDIWNDDKLARHLPFHLNSNAAATCTSFEMVRENGQRSLRRLDENVDWNEVFLYGCHTGPGSTLMADRAVFERVGYLDESLNRLEDWDWALRLVRTEKFAVLDDVLSVVRVSGYPKYEPVASAMEKITAIHELHLSKNPRNWAIFRCSSHIECAYAALHNCLFGAMAMHLLKAFAASPVGFVRAGCRIVRGRLLK